VKENRVVARHEIRRKRGSDSRARGFGVARHLEAEQAARERANRVVSCAATEVEHKCYVTGKSDLRCRPLDLLDQRVLPIPASPRTYTAWPRRVSQQVASAAWNRRNSPRRPTNGRRSRAPAASRKAATPEPVRQSL